MPKKIVDAYDEDGEILASYPILLGHMNMPLTDFHFVEEAKDCHREDGFSPSLVDKWIVRDPKPNE